MRSPPSPVTAVPRCRLVDGPWQGHARGRRLIFLHIPKTAGTAITSFLRQQFAEAAVMPQLEVNFQASHPLWPLIARRSALLGVGMHLEHDHVAALAHGLSHEAPPLLMTVLREPRERLVSRYKEWRSTPDEHMQAARDHVKDAILTARTKSFSEFLRSDNPVVMSTLDNLQTRLLAGLNLSRKLEPSELLERARSNLAEYDLVGTTSTCDQTLRLLAEAYGWPQPKAALARIHQSKAVDDATLRTSDDDEERIAAYTALDQTLWDDLLHGRLPPQPPIHPRAASESPTGSRRRGVAVSGPLCTEPRFLATDLSTAAPGRPHRGPPQPLATTTPGPGHATVMSLIARLQPDRVFGTGRRKWFPGLDDVAEPLTLHERPLFVVRFPALSNQRSLILRQASLPSESLLALTEVDRTDPRLRVLIHQPVWQATCALEGTSEDGVLVFAVGRYRQAHGSESLETAIEVLERCQCTHPAAIRSLRDSPATRVLAQLVIERSLTAALELLANPSSPSGIETLLGTLWPEDIDALLNDAQATPTSLSAAWQSLQSQLAHAQSRTTTASPSSLAGFTASLPFESQPVEVLADCYERVLHVIGDLLPSDPSSPQPNRSSTASSRWPQA